MKFTLSFLTQLVTVCTESVRSNHFGNDGCVRAVNYHNLPFVNSGKPEGDYSSTYGSGKALFESMVALVEEVCTPPTKPEFEFTEEGSAFSHWNLMIHPFSADIKNTRKRNVDLLYSFFDQQRSLVPTHVFDQYDREFKENNLDVCYSILNTVFGDFNMEESSYLKAYAQRAKLAQSKSGILFVDVTTSQTYFLEARGSRGVLIVPNGFLNMNKFFGYSLHLIKMITDSSRYRKKIDTFGKILFNGLQKKTGKTTITVTNNSVPAVKILSYKFYVYCILGMEACNIPNNKIEEVDRLLKKQLFRTQDSMYVVNTEAGVSDYLTQILLFK